MTFTTADLCDAHAEEVTALATSLRSFGGVDACFGPASTVQCYGDNSRVFEAVQEPGAGRVLVVDAGARRGPSMIGGGLAAQAAVNGWAGIIVNGYVRDTKELASLHFAVFALGTVPMRCLRRGEGRRDVDIDICDTLLRPGCWVFADADGILVAARNLIEQPPVG